MNDLHFSVSVGINDYPTFNKLNHAVSDAKEFHQWVCHPQGGNVPAANAELVCGPDPLPDDWGPLSAKPQLNEVLHHLKRFRGQVEDAVRDDPDAWKRTRLYLFCSGHGIAPSANDAALLLANADREEPGYNLSCGKLQEWFQQAQSFRELVFFADCCRERIPGTPDSWLPWLERKGHNGQVRWLLGCATYFGDYAHEERREDVPPDERRGYFTRALMDGLRGAAADKRTCRVTANRLADYVQRRVLHATADRARPQRPTMPFAEDFVVCRVDEVKRASFNVTLVFPSGYQGRVELVGDSDVFSVEISGDAGREKSMTLEEGIYQVLSVEPPDGADPFRTDDGKFLVVKEGQRVEL